jgi:hypothetical protein
VHVKLWNNFHEVYDGGGNPNAKHLEMIPTTDVGVTLIILAR